MSMKILYPLTGGAEPRPFATIVPTGELPLEAVIASVVPAGSPYLLVSEEDFPGDKSHPEAWEADFSQPDGIGGQA